MAVYKPKFKSKGETFQAKIWGMEFVLTGNRIRESTGETNKGKAEAFEAAYRTQLLPGKIGIEPAKEERKAAQTFVAGMSEFLAWSASRHNIAPSTTHRYKIASVSLPAYFGNKKVDTITAGEINEYITQSLRQKSCTAGGTKPNRRRSSRDRF